MVIVNALNIDEEGHYIANPNQPTTTDISQKQRELTPRGKILIIEYVPRII